MPGIPPIPPPMPIGGIAGLSSGMSAIMHSVVRIKLATEAAFCRAVRVTLVGSRTPISIMSPYSPVWFVTGVAVDLTHRFFHSAENDLDTGVLFGVVALDFLDGLFCTD